MSPGAWFHRAITSVTQPSRRGCLGTDWGRTCRALVRFVDEDGTLQSGTRRGSQHEVAFSWFTIRVHDVGTTISRPSKRGRGIVILTSRTVANKTYFAADEVRSKTISCGRFLTIKTVLGYLRMIRTGVPASRQDETIHSMDSRRGFGCRARSFFDVVKCEFARPFCVSKSE
jgi:hypothetical protein